MNVELRPAQPTDAGRVGAILSAFIDRTDWMPRIHTRAEDLAHAGAMIDRGWVTVAETDAGIQGFIARDGSFIHGLYVAAGAQGAGVGQALLAAAQETEARLELWTFKANAGARRFYQRHGFAEAERGDGSTNDEGLPDIRYVWERRSAEPPPPAETPARQATRATDPTDTDTPRATKTIQTVPNPPETRK